VPPSPSSLSSSVRLAFYGATVCLSSAGGLVLEIVAGRLLAPYVGMSLYTWTAIIAVVLAGFSAGHWIGGRLAGPDCDAIVGARRIASALALAAVTSLASLALLRWFSGPLLSAGLPVLVAIVALAALLFLLPSLFVGIVSPIMTKLAVDAVPDDPGRAIGRMYALSAIGAIVGTLAAGYVFISWIGSTGTVLAVTAVYALLALAFASFARTARTIAALLLILTGGFGFAGWRLAALSPPCTVESAYYCIRVEDVSRMFGTPAAVLVLDHLAHGINDRDNPRRLHSSYLHFLDEYVNQRFTPTAPLRVLVAGGGALTLPRAWLAGREAIDITVAELDPAVTRIAMERLWVGSDPRLHIIHGDARLTLQTMPHAPRFDVVFSDVFHDISIPSHLVTREYHQEIKARLAPGGIYAANVIEGGAWPRFLYSLVHTLAEDFASVDVWFDAADAGGGKRSTYVVVASDSPSSVGALTAAHGGRSWVRSSLDLLAPRIAEGRVPVLTDDYAPVDRLLSHVILDRDLSGR
jgi:predicted membrane-bound spermidine synthase